MKSIITIILCLAAKVFFAQDAEYFVNNYLPADYNAGNTNFAIVQDADGRIYSANDNGVLIYNGITWQLIKVGSEETVVSLCAYNNQIFYGTDNGDFGIVKLQDNGKFYALSLSENLTQVDKPLEAIKQIIELDGSIYFLSSDKLIEFKNNNFKSYTPTNAFHIRALLIGKHLFVIDLDNTFLVLENGVLNPVKNTIELAAQKAYFSYKLSPTEYAIGFRNLGLYKAFYNSKVPSQTEFQKFDSPANKELIEAEIVNGASLNGNEFIVTSNKKGAFVLNHKLEIINRFNTKNGVFEDNIKAAFQDKNGNVWFAMYYGISYIEIKSPLQKLTRKNGISGLVSSATYFNNDLYVATDKGVQYFDKISGLFKDLQGFNSQTWYLLNYNKRLLIASGKGIFIYDGKNIIQATDNKTYNYILNDPYQPNLLYCGTSDGVDVFHFANSTLSFIKSYNLYSEVKSIASDHNKNIYFGTIDSYVYFLNYRNSYLLDSITQKDGLPSLGENYVFTYKHKLLIGTDDGLYSVSNLEGKKYICKKDLDFYELTKGKQIFRAAELEGDLICNPTYVSKRTNATEKEIMYVKNDTKRSKVFKSSLSHLKNVKANSISYDSAHKIVLISCDNGLFLLKQQQVQAENTYNLSIAGIYLNEGDTLMSNITSSTAIKQLCIPYSKNNIKIIPGYTCFENSTAFEFSYYLEGQDKNYGDWRKEKQFVFSNLSEGYYTFHLKVRNEFNEKTSEISFSFEVLSPWYRSVFAYVSYVALFLFLMYWIVKFNTRRLKIQNQKLEGVITQRTAVIEEQVHLLEHQKQEITDSINYAQRIQQSILPSFKEINEIHSNGFIFFQPKDIVSGDFYWFKKINENEFLLACADCTGHGVPGAFMSMICSEKLSEGVLHSTSPAKILFHANNSIKEVLKQNQEEEGKSKDGMEISLIRYNIQTNCMSYAGANRPLWLIKHTSKELIEIKPTKASIASFTEFNFEYEQHNFVLENNDIVYLTSDGFPDQFGGPDGRKFMTKNMKTFLIKISELPIEKQKELVSNKINDWMGKLEQVDDLLVIGLKA